MRTLIAVAIRSISPTLLGRLLFLFLHPVRFEIVLGCRDIPSVVCLAGFVHKTSCHLFIGETCSGNALLGGQSRSQGGHEMYGAVLRFEPMARRGLTRLEEKGSCITVVIA
jgi:hypothetical protein